MEKRIKAFLAKKSKAARVLELLLDRQYVTGDDIINIYRMTDPECEHSFTTNPQGLIETIRKHFGYDFVKDESLKFYRTMYTAKGKPYKISDTYKKYFIDKMAMIEGV